MNAVQTRSPSPSQAPRHAEMPGRIRLACGGVLLAAYIVLRPWGPDGEPDDVSAWGDVRWPLTHLAAVLGFVAIASGIHAMTRESRSRRLIDASSWTAVAMLLPYYGAEAYALHAIAEHGVSDETRLAEAIRMGGIQASTFAIGWLALAVLGFAFVLELRHQGLRTKAAAWTLAAGLATYLPVFYLPPAARVAHALLVGAAAVAVAVVVQPVGVIDTLEAHAAGDSEFRRLGTSNI